ncbi:hypothetical protein MFLAVUS_007237 [Mucor flavus]|uniref:F-box domain-containing protein n=1 Tax=Mucor flavus TaxID=439312 RepID=A0ABP9Z3S0_9FUNG
MDGLPAETLTNIFRHLKRKDLQACYFVCKSWYTSANTLRWKDVTLRPRTIPLVKSHLNDLGHNQYFKCCHLIKKLAFQDAPSEDGLLKFSRPELLLLLDLLPNLNEIDFSVTNFPEDYLECLLHTDMQHIKRINTGANISEIRCDLLLSVYYKFRNSITHIRLVYDRDEINFNSQHMDLIDSLTRFKKLTKLVFYNINNIHLTPFQILDNCPNLEHFKFISSYPISEAASRHILDDNRRLNLNLISNLTNLDLRLPFLSTTYTLYLVDYFPNHLTDLYIEIFLQNIFYWIPVVGLELALRFMEKAGGIEDTYIGFLKSEEYTLPEENENNMANYFELLNSFRGTRQTQCTANFDGNLGAIERLGHSFRYDCLDRLFATYNLYLGDLYDPDDIAVPDETSSIIGPEIFHVLEFNLSNISKGEVHRVLNYSLSNCPNIRILDIISYVGLPWHYSLSLRHKGRPMTSDQATRDINFLRIEYIKPSKSLFDLVTTHLHNIEIVSIKANDRSIGRLNDLVIDLTGFKKLKSFRYTSTDNFSNENKFVLIKYTNGIERRIREYHSNPKKLRDKLNFTVLCDISVSLDFCKEK